MTVVSRDGVDVDELARLEEERDFLLTSLRDLELEREAGDIDELDYTRLRDDYTARAATVLRAIGQHASRQGTRSKERARSRRSPSKRRRRGVTPGSWRWSAPGCWPSLSSPVCWSPGPRESAWPTDPSRARCSRPRRSTT